MIIALIIWLLRRKPCNRIITSIPKKILGSNPVHNKSLLLLVLSFLLSVSLLAQQQVFNYHIVYKNSVIGHMQYQQQKTGNDLYLKIVSDAETKMLMTIKVNVQEEAHYTNDKLVYSYIQRYINGKRKIFKQTKALGDVYQTSSDGKNGALINYPIDCNFTLLYSREPVNIGKVYADAFQEFVTVKTIQPHVYKIELPDGSYNMYYYKNGICNKVDVHNTWCTVQMQLAQNSIL